MTYHDRLATVIRLQGYVDRIKFHRNAGRRYTLRGIAR